MNRERSPTGGDSRRGAATGPAPIPQEEIFDVLSNRRRQCVLHQLKRNGEMQLAELVAQVAAWENDTHIADLGTKERKRVYNALHQTHLPRLQQAGMIEYDRRDDRVSLTEAGRNVELYLEYVPDSDVSWHRRYLRLSILTVALTAIVWADVYPFGALSSVVVLGAAFAAFAVASIVHVYHARKNRSRARQRFEVHQ